MSRTPRTAPLLSLEMQAPAKHRSRSPDDDEDDGDDDDGPVTKQWYHYLPVGLIVAIALAPYPSLLRVLLNYHLKTLHSPLSFGVHLLALLTLTFGIFASLIVCVTRDPGLVGNEAKRRDVDANGDMDLTEALMVPERDDERSLPGRFCYKCYAPKPERAHHCGVCGRCILKMDHHCGWLATCVGHRTYPAFLHFLCCITLFSLYVAVLSINALIFAFQNPLAIDATTPVHELFLSFAGIAFTLVVGAFFLYHVYLVSTNQTTLESLSPFLLLRYLPPVPLSHTSSPSSPSHRTPPRPVFRDQDRMTRAQRHAVRNAHSQIFIYDVGWKRNWAQIVGWDNHYHGQRAGRGRWVAGWVWRIMCGGVGKGDGRTFPRNPRAEEMLARLDQELQRLDKEL